jgi:hypothetical protein
MVADMQTTPTKATQMMESRNRLVLSLNEEWSRFAEELVMKDGDGFLVAEGKRLQPDLNQ